MIHCIYNKQYFFHGWVKKLKKKNWHEEILRWTIFLGGFQDTKEILNDYWGG